MSEEHTDNLKKALARLIEQRRAFVKVLAGPYERGKTEQARETFDRDRGHEPGHRRRREIARLGPCAVSDGANESSGALRTHNEKPNGGAMPPGYSSRDDRCGIVRVAA